jgi:hypothetical protein
MAGVNLGHARVDRRTLADFSLLTNARGNVPSVPGFPRVPGFPGSPGSGGDPESRRGTDGKVGLFF